MVELRLWPSSAEGVLWVFHGLRGVIHIMWGVIDKAGFNWLFIPYQSPHSSLPFLPISKMPAIHSSYIVPFNPLGNPGGTILAAAQRYNRMFRCSKQGSATSPYSDLVLVYRWLVVSNSRTDMFEDLYLDDCHE
jgi:hypothetical protein